MQDTAVGTLTVRSSAFGEKEMIPSIHTCDGENISPDLSWSGAPAGVAGYLVLMEDPDIPIPRFIVPAWVHWIVYNIPPETVSLPEAFSADAAIAGGPKPGVNSYRKMRYDGPCPPFGTHRYIFKVYALDKVLDLLPNKASKKAILKQIEGHVLASGELTGLYKRRK